MAPQTTSFPAEVSKVLKGTKVLELLTGQKAVTVDEKMSVVQASAVLATQGISSAPIVSEKGFVGMVDYADVAHLLIAGLRAQRSIDFSLGFEEQLTTLLESGLGPGSSVKLASDMSKTNPMTVIRQDATLEDAARMFVDQDLHRLCVVNELDVFVGVISQSDLLQFIKKNMASAFPDLVSSSVESLGLLEKKVITLPADRPVLEALELMVDLKISSVGIVDVDSGDLITVISLSDCKKIVKEGHKLPLLKVDAREFAAKIRSDAALERNHGADAFPFFAVHKDTPLKTAIAKLCAVRAHRLFIIEGGDDCSTKPIGVLSISDILKALAKQA